MVKITLLQDLCGLPYSEESYNLATDKEEAAWPLVDDDGILIGIANEDGGFNYVTKFMCEYDVSDDCMVARPTVYLGYFGI